MTEKAKAFVPADVTDDLGSIRYPARAEVKHDGVRLVAEIDAAGAVTLRSKTGREYSLPTISAAVRGLGLRETVLDGELVTPSFEETLSVIQGGILEMCARFVVFDLILPADRPRPFHYRRKGVVLLGMTSPPDSALKVAEGRIVHDGAAAGAYFREVTEEGGEGIVLKNLNSRYGEVGAWVRLVKHVTYDGVVVDVIEGRGKFAGTLGKLVVEIDGPGGVRTKVTNFCDDERAEIWGNRAALVGRWVELRAKCKTAAGSLREPCFLRFREDKGTASTAKNAKSAKDGTA